MPRIKPATCLSHSTRNCLIYSKTYLMIWTLVISINNIFLHSSTVATDALVVKHQAISIHSIDWMITVSDQFYTEILQLQWTILDNKITFWKKNHPGLNLYISLVSYLSLSCRLVVHCNFLQHPTLQLLSVLTVTRPLTRLSVTLRLLHRPSDKTLRHT